MRLKMEKGKERKERKKAMDLFHFGTSSNLILMDYDMLVMNGAEQLFHQELLRQNEELRRKTQLDHFDLQSNVVPLQEKVVEVHENSWQNEMGALSLKVAIVRLPSEFKVPNEMFEGSRDPRAYLMKYNNYMNVLGASDTVNCKDDNEHPNGFNVSEAEGRRITVGLCQVVPCSYSLANLYERAHKFAEAKEIKRATHGTSQRDDRQFIGRQNAHSQQGPSSYSLQVQ
ncbi:hypothetical protein Gotri_027543, partial [Gossypium trilobum]|nr:hypothetical protein [Gossypium trilobum]